MIGKIRKFGKRNFFLAATLIGLVTVGGNAMGGNALFSHVNLDPGQVLQLATISSEKVSTADTDDTVSGDPIHGSGGVLPGEYGEAVVFRIKNNGTADARAFYGVTSVGETVMAGVCGYTQLKVGIDTTGDNVPEVDLGQHWIGNLASSMIEVEDVLPDDATLRLVIQTYVHPSMPNSFNGTGATCTWTNQYKTEQIAP